MVRYCTVQTWFKICCCVISSLSWLVVESRFIIFGVSFCYVLLHGIGAAAAAAFS